MKQKLQFSILFLFINLFVIAQTFDVGNLRYNIISGTNVSVRNTDTYPTGALAIPATVVNTGTTYTVTSINDNGFFNCTGLTSVDIPNTVTNIGINAFRECYALTSVNIPNTVTTIGSSAFQNCAALTSITLPNSITSISNTLFYACSSLASVVIPNSVTTIGSAAFFGCSNLSSVTIPNSVTLIRSQSFVNCSSLTSLTIPNSVTTIENQVFANCTGLTSVTVNWTAPLVINANVFQNVNTTIIPLNVPSGSEALYEANAVWTTFNPINGFLSAEDFNNVKVSIYPNPTSNFITVSGLFNSESYVIYDMMGRALQNGDINDNNTINIENLSNGSYILKLTNGFSSSIIKK